MKVIIEAIEKNSAIKPEPEDYVQDGLLHCGKCKTPKQGIYTVPWGEIKPYILCKCEAEKRDREAAEIILREKVERYRKTGFPNSNMLSWTFENSDGSNEKNMQAMKKYVENFSEYQEQGKGLVLFGTVGTGKSYAAACVVNALINKGCRAIMTDFRTIEKTVSGNYSDKKDYFDTLSNVPLLVLDDLNAERRTEYMQEMVLDIIDGRVRSGLPTIVTTNLTWKELVSPNDIQYQRVFSRLLGASVPVKFEGADKRIEALEKSLASERESLGL